MSVSSSRRRVEERSLCLLVPETWYIIPVIAARDENRNRTTSSFLFVLRFVSVRSCPGESTTFFPRWRKRKEREREREKKKEITTCDSFPNSNRKPSCEIHFLGLKQDVKATRMRVILGITEFRQAEEEEKKTSLSNLSLPNIFIQPTIHSWEERIFQIPLPFH